MYTDQLTPWQPQTNLLWVTLDDYDTIKRLGNRVIPVNHTKIVVLIDLLIRLTVSKC